ncbi:MAG: methionyl-tRNA formyltransferase [Candidatus Paceibacterota bacterium]
MHNNTSPHIVFFGTSHVSVVVLEELKKSGFLPQLIVTAPDTKQGRKMVLTAPEAKLWAQENDIPVLQPEKITLEVIADIAGRAPQGEWDLFIIAAYGKLLPKEFLDLPTFEVINVHPSLLPRLRGANPIRGAILADEKEVGVSIMLVDEEMDHGPVLAQKVIPTQKWPMRGAELDALLAHAGGVLLTETIPQWINGVVTPQEQKHEDATHTKKVVKEDGLIDLQGDPYQNLLKIRAYEGWPGTYFFKNETRIKITDAEIKDGALNILRVIPEGKKEMPYAVFMKDANLSQT